MKQFPVCVLSKRESDAVSSDFVKGLTVHCTYAMCNTQSVSHWLIDFVALQEKRTRRKCYENNF